MNLEELGAGVAMGDDIAIDGVERDCAARGKRDGSEQDNDARQEEKLLHGSEV